jgi:hypothetical protein
MGRWAGGYKANPLKQLLERCSAVYYWTGRLLTMGD